MTRTELLDHIEDLAGAHRAVTFRAAAEFILRHDLQKLVETGTYRGLPEGNSTLILARLAEETGGLLVSYDIDPEAICQAEAMVLDHRVRSWVHLVEGDSVTRLGARERPIQFAYLDSFDCGRGNDSAAQCHQLAEVGAILGKMDMPSAILLDDVDYPGGGKAALSAPFLESRGWRTLAKGYQQLFVRT